MVSSLPSFCCMTKPFWSYRKRKYPLRIIVSQRFEDEGNSHNNFVDANLRVLSRRIEALRRKEKGYDNGWSYIKPGSDGEKHKREKIDAMLSASAEVVKSFISGLVLVMITCSLLLFLVSLLIHMYTL